ncbi:DUF5819 family protein [Streptomyces sp. SCUT-3]|uniref:DUF5819 family protein n=1 Tax=Streptomyces sp. SCUT-3 TaxID=2684469 RepID=UPI001C717A68|nr:DUF5819 family protein [Streptomyces sp. SCUT-3]
MEPATISPRADGPGEGGGSADSGGGIASLSPVSRFLVAAAVSVAVVASAVHLGAVFLHVAPANTVSKQYDAAVDDYVYPEFEQNWKLFAPNPLQQNVAVHARAEVLLGDGRRTTTGWVDLTAEDFRAVRHNPAPSHINQNELRRAWDFYVNSHDEENRPNGTRGELSSQYVKNIVCGRLGPRLNGGEVVRIQVRSAATPVASPKWSSEKVSTQTAYRVLPWWTVEPEDFGTAAPAAGEDAR